MFGFPDLPERESGPLLIRPSRLVRAVGRVGGGVGRDGCGGIGMEEGDAITKRGITGLTPPRCVAILDFALELLDWVGTDQSMVFNWEWGMGDGVQMMVVVVSGC